MNTDNLFISFLIVLMCGLGFLAYKVCERDERLRLECMKDHKEYECVAMLRNHSSNGIATGLAIGMAAGRR